MDCKYFPILAFKLCFIFGCMGQTATPVKHDFPGIAVETYAIRVPGQERHELVGQPIERVLQNHDAFRVAASGADKAERVGINVYTDEDGFYILQVTYDQNNDFLSSDDRDVLHLISIDGIVVSLSTVIGRPFTEFPVNLGGPISGEMADFIRERYPFD